MRLLLVEDNPDLADANIAALDAGHAYGETAELSGPLRQVHVDAVPTAPGLYRTITGAEAVALGLVAGARLLRLPLFFGGYPITPASAILHHLARLKEFNVTTFQAEDEIAAIGAVPYAANNDAWFALSNLSLPTKFGTVASFAGDQKSVRHSTKIMAA